MSAIQSYMKGNTSGAIGALTGMGKKLMSNNSGAAQKSKADKASNADVISWSGCKDSQVCLFSLSGLDYLDIRELLTPFFWIWLD